MSVLESKLAKRGSKDLIKKMQSPKSTEEEIKVISGILKKRGVGTETKPTVKATAKASNATPSSEATGKKTRTPNKDITSTDVAVGNTVEFKAKSKDEFNGTVLTGEVIKVYTCNRSGKDYVRIKAEGRIFHKTLAYFKKEEK
jgi:hypothetical protein